MKKLGFIGAAVASLVLTSQGWAQLDYHYDWLGQKEINSDDWALGDDFASHALTGVTVDGRARLQNDGPWSTTSSVERVVRPNPNTGAVEMIVDLWAGDGIQNFNAHNTDGHPFDGFSDAVMLLGVTYTAADWTVCVDRNCAVPASAGYAARPVRMRISSSGVPGDGVRVDGRALDPVTGEFVGDWTPMPATNHLRDLNLTLESPNDAPFHFGFTILGWGEWGMVEVYTNTGNDGTLPAPGNTSGAVPDSLPANGFQDITTGACEIPDTLVAHYSFDDGTARDVTGNGNDGVPEGAQAADEPQSDGAGSGVDGAGEAFRFNGQGRVEIPVDINPTVLPQLTVTMWVLTDDASAGRRKVFGHDDGALDRVFGLETLVGTRADPPPAPINGATAGPFRWAAFTGLNYDVATAPTGTPVATEWTFLAVVYDADAGTVRFHAALQGGDMNFVDELTSNTDGHDTASIGSLNADDAFTEGFTGLIDEVMIFRTALTAEEIEAIRNGGGPSGDDGTCSILTAEECAAQGGNYGGNGSGCPTGGCDIAGICELFTAEECAAQGGTYSGDDVECRLGACQLPTGICEVFTSGECQAASGFYNGDDTVCGTGACQLPGGTCSVVTNSVCAAASGVYDGDDSVCVPNVSILDYHYDWLGQDDINPAVWALGDDFASHALTGVTADGRARLQNPGSWSSSISVERVVRPHPISGAVEIIVDLWAGDGLQNFSAHNTDEPPVAGFGEGSMRLATTWNGSANNWTICVNSSCVVPAGQYSDRPVRMRISSSGELGAGVNLDARALDPATGLFAGEWVPMTATHRSDRDLDLAAEAPNDPPFHFAFTILGWGEFGMVEVYQSLGNDGTLPAPGNTSGALPDPRPSNGFQQFFSRGDVNADGFTDLSDSVYTFNHLFNSGPGFTCQESANLDTSDPNINLADGVFGLNFLFLGGPPPPPPYPDCDMPPGPVDCALFEPCD